MAVPLLVRSHKRHLTKYQPGAMFNVMHFIIIGDSLASAIGPANAPQDAMVVDANVAWNVYGHSTLRQIEVLAKANAIIGDAAPWVTMAQRLWELLGIRSIWTSYAQGSIGICKASSPTRHWDCNDITPTGGNMLYQDDGSVDRATIKPVVTDILAGAPAFTVTARHMVFVGGSFDAKGIHDGTIVQNTTAQTLKLLRQHMITLWGSDRMFLFESGIIGSTALEVADDQATFRDMVALRAAQNQACAEDNRILNVYPAYAADPGNVTYMQIEPTPLYLWRDGSERFDGAHYTDFMNEIMGNQAAEIIADAGVLGVKNPSPTRRANPATPVITGTRTVGSVLTCGQGVWSPVATSWTYQWRRNVTTILGSSATYTLVAGDVGQEISCRVVATNANGSRASVAFAGTIT